jgi:uncharacterized iron-regulated membrane protein
VKKNIKLIFGKIHLWLGLLTGLLVFILAITGCLYAFQEEIQDYTQSYRHVKPDNKPYLRPTDFQEIAAKALPGKHLHAIKYMGQSRSVEAIYYNYEPLYYFIAYLDPYTGEVLKVNNMEEGFFRFVLDGHFYLWLPPEIGQPVVATVTALFIIMLISGLILWLPAKVRQLKSRLWLKWNNRTRWRRKNYDLHQVSGIYAMLFGLFFAITGLNWGFPVFAEAYYKLLGGEQELLYTEPESQPGSILSVDSIPLNIVWEKMMKEYPNAASIEVHPPETSLSPIAANANFEQGTYWKTDYRYFDQFSLKELNVKHVFGRLEDQKFADKAIRMNYDLHTGAILGLPGKIIAFMASLIIAILPLTGFMIWYGRRKKGLKGGYD